MLVPYHFTDRFREGFFQYKQIISKLDGIICFDLEDIIHPHLISNTDARKDLHRRHIIKGLSRFKSTELKRDFGIRINPTYSPAFYKDVNFLNKNIPAINCIFLPKTESPEALQKAIELIQTDFVEIIPIIESQRGMDNLVDILSVEDSRFRKIAFGHCDFNLDTNIFPFIHQDNSQYWEWINYLHIKCIQHEKDLINSPVLVIHPDNYFKANLQKTKQFSRIKGQISLCKRQTEMIHSINTGLQALNNFHPPFPEIENALKLKKTHNFEDNMMIVENGIVISPQYILALENQNNR